MLWGRFLVCGKEWRILRMPPEDTVSVENHIKLIEPAVILLGQEADSILYGQHLQILKSSMKDPQKNLNALKEKADLI